MMTLLNGRSGGVVASEVEVAHTRATRRRGLLGRNHLDASAALVLSPCVAVHTAFMRFSIDVVFVDRAGTIVRIVHRMAPWRIAGSRRAHTVIELAGGCASARDLAVGDRLYFASVAVSADGGVTSTFSFDVGTSLRSMASRPAC
jgi:uncharacterized membrane protein (UPF0127 family)